MTGKKTKYGSRRIPACPRCWGPISASTENMKSGPFFCISSACLGHRKGIIVDIPVYFMSKNEANIGFHLKSLELRNKIKELKMQESFDLVKVKWVDAIGIYDHHFYSKLGEANINMDSVFPSPYNHYKSDFSFTDATEKKRVIEVKGDCKKKSRKKHGVTPEREPVYLTTIKDYPYFGREQPFPQFVIKAKLMLLLHGLNVEVWTPKRRFVFDTTWKLQEIDNVRI